jgi:hypothetical protein
MAHQSVFPPSSSSESETDESDKETEADSDEEVERRHLDPQSRMMGQSRALASGKGRGKGEEKSRSTSTGRGYAITPSELYEDGIRDDQSYAGGGVGVPSQGEMEARGGKVPTRLHVYHGRFGHWEREGLRKYKGKLFFQVLCRYALIQQIQVYWRCG